MGGRLYAYGDESGIEEGAEWCILAGYIGAPRQVERFGREWRRVLRRYRVPEFHAKDFFQPERRKRVAHYADWRDERAGDFLGALLNTINDRDIDPIAVSVHVPSFNDFDEDQRRYLTGGLLRTHAAGYPDGSTVVFAEKFKSNGAPSRPYLAIFQRFVGEALLKAASTDTAVHFTFDLQNVIQSRAIETFQEQFKGSYLPETLRELGKRAASIRYADSKDEALLQAADLSAYFWNRAMNDAMRSPLLRQTALAFGVKPHRMTQFNREHLQKILDSTLDDTIAQIRKVQHLVGNPIEPTSSRRDVRIPSV